MDEKERYEQMEMEIATVDATLIDAARGLAFTTSLSYSEVLSIFAKLKYEALSTITDIVTIANHFKQANPDKPIISFFD